jgi:hypothetical protein
VQYLQRTNGPMHHIPVEARRNRQALSQRVDLAGEDELIAVAFTQVCQARPLPLRKVLSHATAISSNERP